MSIDMFPDAFIDYVLRETEKAERSSKVHSDYTRPGVEPWWENVAARQTSTGEYPSTEPSETLADMSDTPKNESLRAGSGCDGRPVAPFTSTPKTGGRK